MAVKDVIGGGIGFGGPSYLLTDGFGFSTAIAASTAKQLRRLEVWSNWQCASGTRQAFIQLSEVVALTTTERTQHDDEGQLVVSKESGAAAYIATGSVLRLLFSDGSFDEWIIWSIDDSSKESRVLRVSLRSVLTSLDSGMEVLNETVGSVTSVSLEWKGLTPSTIVSQTLAFAPSWWTAGTIDPTIPVDLSPDGWMPLRAFRELVAAIRAQAVGCELHYRRNGTSGYFIDILTSIGSSEATLDVRTRKNLIGMSRRRDREKYAVEVVPLGAGSPRPTIAKAWWECTAKAGAVLTLQQPVTGGKMIGFDDQLNGLYLIDDTGARQLISDSDATTQQVTVASGTNFTSGRWYRVAEDSAGSEKIQLRKAAATTGAVRLVESSTLDGTTNLQTNPAMRVWTGSASSAPDGWSTSGGPPTLARTTTPGLWLYGGQSCRVTVTAATIITPSVTIYVPTWATSITYSVWIYPVSTIPASSTLSADVDGVQAGATTDIRTIPVGSFSRVSITIASGAYTTGAVHALRSRINFAGAGTMDAYVDSSQIEFSASATSFVEGSNPAKLWALGNQYLSNYSTAPTSYGATFADLNQWDPNGFPYDVVALGQTANVRDTDLDVTTTGRIIELRRDWKHPLSSHLTISTRPEEFVSLLTGIAA